jgi:cysteine desulfurase
MTSSMKVYLDNAATTRLDPEVLQHMLPYLTEHFGNPSSIHAHGRPVRSAIEQARKKIASMLNATPAEIFFTSGGTEADNMAIRGSVHSLGVKRIISSPLEHHAVLHTVEHLEQEGLAQLDFVQFDEQGVIDLNHLDNLLANGPKTLISLMHGNNEIGNMNDLDTIGHLAHKYGALFHSDTVQTMGHYRFDVRKTPIDYLVGSAHKFHGPKGVGFIFINQSNKINPYIQGGSQERNMRGGTENVYGIVGMAKALELCYQELDEHEKHIKTLKERMISQLRSGIQGVEFNGTSDSLEKSLYTVLSVSLPPHEINEMLLFNLDIQEISASGGSACTSGSNAGSHVIRALNRDQNRAVVRFSFCRNTSAEEVDHACKVLIGLYAGQSVGV